MKIMMCTCVYCKKAHHTKNGSRVFTKLTRAARHAANTMTRKMVRNEIDFVPEKFGAKWMS